MMFANLIEIVLVIHKLKMVSSMLGKGNVTMCLIDKCTMVINILCICVDKFHVSRKREQETGILNFRLHCSNKISTSVIFHLNKKSVFTAVKDDNRYYRPPEGGRLYDMKVVSGYAFLRTYYV